MYTVMIDFADGSKMKSNGVLSMNIRPDHAIELLLNSEPPLTITKKVAIISVFRDE